MDHVSHVKEKENAYMVRMGKSDGKRACGRTRHRWDYSIEVDLKYIKDGKAWTGLILLRIGASGRYSCQH
jgi:hypothetical protein